MISKGLMIGIVVILLLGCDGFDHKTPNMDSREPCRLKLVSKFDSEGSKTIGSELNGSKQGLWLKKDSNNRTIFEMCYMNDTLHGQYALYRNNGELMQTGNYNMGELHGNYLTYFSDGLLSDSGRYENGKKVGIWKFYVESDPTYNFEGGLNYVIEYKNDSTLVIKDNGLEPDLPDGTPAWKKYGK